MNAINFDSFQANAELNNLQKTVNTKTEGVEIFSAMCAGKDTSKYGDKVDKVNNYMKSRGQAALNGDLKAQAELNAIRTEMIEMPLLKRLNIFDFMGEKISVGFNEELRYRVQKLEGKMSGEQAINGSFPFGSYTWETEVMKTGNITGGVIIDNREYAAGNTDAIQVANEQCVTDMMNKMFYKVQLALYNGIKNATIKNFGEAAGITKTHVDQVIKNARHNGAGVNIMGDYSVISQLVDFTGFSTNSTTKQFSDAVMEEIRRTGLLNSYKGSPVVEIPNSLNLTKTKTDSVLNTTFYDTYLAEGLLYFLVSGAMSPLKIGIKGGLQSMAGQDIALRANVVRYDMEFGTAFIEQYSHNIGLISDTNYSVTK